MLFDLKRGEVFVKLFALLYIVFSARSSPSVFHVLCISTTALLPALYTVCVEYIRGAAEYQMLGAPDEHTVLVDYNLRTLINQAQLGHQIFKNWSQKGLVVVVVGQCEW